MIIATAKKYYTPEEYLELEEKSDEKHEYRDREIIPITGGTTNHNRIVIDFCTYLNLALMRQKSEIFSSDVRLWIPDYREFTYPDVMVVEGKPVYYPPGKTTITNPSIIVEVLSKSTRSHDQGDKFRYYRSIPQFKEYILIDQYSVLVEQFVKMPDGKWILSEYNTEEAILTLESIQFQISLKDLYKRVDFDLGDET